jgi:carbon starvation protein CstA
MLIRMDKARYAWITIIPGLFMAVVFVLAVRRWIQLLRIAERVQDTWGETVLQIVQE